MKHRTGLKICSLLLVLALVSSFACAPTEEVEEPEKVITIGTAAMFPTGFNPFVQESNVFFELQRWIWDSLYEPGPEDKAIPDLAKEVVVSPDRKTYTITIRDNAQWQDGVPLTAHDVAFTYNYIIDNEMGWYASLCTQLSQIKAIDDYTVEVKLKEAVNRDWINYNPFYIIPVLPQHIWQDITGEEALAELPLEKCIGSGPYQVVEFVRDEHIRVRATPQAKEELGVNIDEYIIKLYADASVMLEDLKAGNIDAIYRLPLKAAPALEAVPEITLEVLAPIIMDEVIFNSWSHAYEEGRKTHPHPALKDVRVREALDWAFDEEVAAEISYGKYGIPGCQYLSVYWKDFSNTELDCRGYDLDKARQILDEAGYLDTDGDGIRETAEGQPLEFDVFTESDAVDVPTVWARETEKIGIKLNVSVMDSDTLWSSMNPNGDFDIGIWGWLGDPDPHYLLCTMLCEQAVEGGWSEAGYCNPQYDEWYGQAALAPTREDRRELYWKMQELLYDEMPYIVYVYYGSICATRNDKVAIDLELMEGTSDGIGNKLFAINADTVS